MLPKPKSVNEPFPKMTDAELVENRAYWYDKLASSPGVTSSVAAHKFIGQIEKEMTKRGLKYE